MATDLQINFRDFLPEGSVKNPDRKEIIRTVMDAYEANYCTIDGEIDGLLVITDVDDAPEEFLDYIAALVGLELLGLDTVEQKRSLIKNAVAIYKIKGTNESWQIIFKTLGFETDVIELWYDNTGGLIEIDPMLGHLNTGNNSLLGTLTIEAVDNLTPSLGDSYIMSETGVLALGALAVTAGDAIDFDGGFWVNLGVPLDPINPDLVLLGRYTVAEFNNPALNPLGRLTQAQIDAILSPVTGDTYEVEDLGTLTLGSLLVAPNDIIQWDGAGWILIPHYKTIDQLSVDISRPIPSDGIFSQVILEDITSPGTLDTLRVAAGDVGSWGDQISVRIEDGTAPLTQFNLVVLFNAVEVDRFDDLAKDLNVGLDDIEQRVNTETFYIDVTSIGTFSTELRPANGTFVLAGGVNPKNTKSAYVDIILSIDFINCLIEADFLNKAAFFDGRIKEVKPAHIRIRFKRIDLSVSEPADLVFDDDDLTVITDVECVDVLQPTCDPPPGAIVVYFHNGFILTRTGTFNRFYSVEFPNGIPDTPGAVSDIGGYIYAYDGLEVGSHGLTYGDTVDSLGNPFIYEFTFDPEVCATDTVTAIVDNDAIPLQDDTFYGVSISQRITYNGTFSFNGYMAFNDTPIDPVTVDSDPTDNPDPQGGVTVVRCLPATDECILVQPWKYSDT